MIVELLMVSDNIGDGTLAGIVEESLRHTLRSFDEQTVHPES